MHLCAQSEAVASRKDDPRSCVALTGLETAGMRHSARISLCHGWHGRSLAQTSWTRRRECSSPWQHLKKRLKEESRCLRRRHICASSGKLASWKDDPGPWVVTCTGVQSEDMACPKTDDPSSWDASCTLVQTFLTGAASVANAWDNNRDSGKLRP
mmetsp:Transcript_5402/g.8706  ORF Transcript_5402/g.8706 Transcript_5402/m.8706 type:complete len:155 (-) Transcript_5402:792-1256(-)